jgi:hypothetical protein
MNEINHFIEKYVALPDSPDEARIPGALGQKETSISIDAMTQDTSMISFNTISRETVRELEAKGYSIEDLLQTLVDDYGCLLHGSTVDIAEGYLRPAKRMGNDTINATIFAPVAIVKAILSNEGANLRYPLDTLDPAEFYVDIHGKNSRTVSEKGYIYVIAYPMGFKQHHKKSYLTEFVKEGKDPVPFSSKIEVSLKDLWRYPISDIDNKKLIF